MQLSIIYAKILSMILVNHVFSCLSELRKHDKQWNRQSWVHKIMAFMYEQVFSIKSLLFGVSVSFPFLETKISLVPLAIFTIYWHQLWCKLGEFRPFIPASPYSQCKALKRQLFDPGKAPVDTFQHLLHYCCHQMSMPSVAILCKAESKFLTWIIELTMAFHGKRTEVTLR